MFAKETYVARRRQLKESVGSGLLLFLGNDECGMNYEDNTYNYRQDSSFLYFWGLSYAGLAAVIDIDEGREIIFGDELTIDHIVWMGTQPTLHEKAQRVGVTETLPLAELKKYVEKVVAQKRTVHYLPPYRAEHRLKLMNLLGVKPGAEMPSVSFIKGIVNLRNYKTEEEIAEIERACDVTAEMHLEAMRVLRVGMKEHEVAAHQAAVNALKPGVYFRDVYDLSCRVICEGLKGLGLMKGNPADAVEQGAHAMFFPCGLGHMMGLDVHDMENLGEVWVGYDGQPKSTQFGRKSLRLARKLEPGFVLTIEPGIYFIPELMDYWKAEHRFTDFINYEKLESYRDFTGLRNEEDYLITATGARRLGKKIPLTTEEVEAMR